MEPITTFIGSLVLGGLTNAAWDAVKYGWKRITHKTWEDLLLDAFDAAFQEMRPSLVHYASDGEIGLSRQDLAKVLRHDLAIDISTVSSGEMDTEAFTVKLAEAMTEQSVLTIGGNNLSGEDYSQLVRNTIARARNEFREAILSNDDAFRRAMLQFAELNQAAVREVLAQLSRNFEDFKTQVAALEAALAAAVPRRVFLTLDAYRATVKRTARRLPLSEKMVGREPDLANAVLATERGNRVLIIDGDPGIGKSRFCAVLAETLLQKPEFAEHVLRFLRDAPSDLWQSMDVELGRDRPYIVVVDDANRIDNLALLSRLLTDTSRPDGSVLVLNVRSYSRDTVKQNIRTPDLEDISTITLKQLSKTDIDVILSNQPFNLPRETRKHLIEFAKGNPRLAAVAAEALRTNGHLPDAQIDLFQTYFEGVFDDLRQMLQDKPKHRRLLGMIAALRSVDLDNADLVARLASQLGFTNPQDLRDAVDTLHDSEIVDVRPASVARVFDDNVSEYIVYREFFENRPGSLDYLQAVVREWASTAAQPIFENLVALRRKGYTSPRLTKLLSELVDDTRRILWSDSDEGVKSYVLGHMKLYVRSNPLPCFELVEAHTQLAGIAKLTPDVAAAILDIAEPALLLEWEVLLERGANLLRQLYSHSDPTVSKEAHDRLQRLFRYIARPISDTQIRFYYGPHARLVALIEGWLAPPRGHVTVELCVDCLSKLCLHHAEHEEMDYLDDNTYRMAAWPLAINGVLKEIRARAFAALAALYEQPSTTIELRLKIIKALESALDQFLPIGGSTPSPELAKYDASVLLPLIQPIAMAEPHLVLLEHCSDLLGRIEEELNDGRAAAVRKLVQTDLLSIFQKFSDTYWFDVRRVGSDIESSMRQAEDFFAGFGVGIAPGGLVRLLTRIQEDASSEQAELWRLRGYMHILGARDAIVARRVLELISDANHPLQIYVSSLLAGLSTREPAARREAASKWLANNNITQLRALAASYSWRDDNLDRADVQILEQLVEITDPDLDWLLVQSFVAVEGIAPDKVGAALLQLAQRAQSQTYSKLLELIQPEDAPHGRTYTLHQSNPESFQQIVLVGARMDFANRHGSGRALGICLGHLANQDLQLLLAFIRQRKEYCEEEQRSHRYAYALLPPETDLRFASSRPNYETFLEELLALISQDDGRGSASYVDVLESILTGHIRTLPRITSELDPITNDVLFRWASGSPEQLRTVLKVLSRIHPWQSWFGIMRQIVERQDFAELGLTYDNLMSPLFAATYSSSASHSRQLLELTRRQRRPADSKQMCDFLGHIEMRLQQFVERKAEREQPEAEAELPENDD